MRFKRIVSIAVVVAVIMSSLSSFGFAFEACATSFYVNVTKTAIPVQGLKKTYKFLQITDLHITELPDMSDERYEYSLARRLQFGALTGFSISSLERLYEFFDYAAEENVDAILFTGDIIDCPTPTNIARFTEALSRCPVPYIYVTGNHDYTFPDHYFDQLANQTYHPLLEEFANGNSFYNYIEYDDLIVVLIDDSQEKIMSASIATFVRKLNDTGKPVLMGYHVPFYSDTLIQPMIDIWDYDRMLSPNRGPEYYDLRTRTVYEYVTSPDNNLIATICGHMHTERVDTLSNGKLQYMSSASYEGGGRLITLNPQIGEPCKHSFNSIVTREATRKTRGEIKHTCTLCGYSYLEAIPVIDYKTGDINSDNIINSVDVERLRLYLAGIFTKMSERNIRAADINKDGKVSLVDILILRKYLAGRIDSL